MQRHIVPSSTRNISSHEHEIHAIRLNLVEGDRVAGISTGSRHHIPDNGYHARIRVVEAKISPKAHGADDVVRVVICTDVDNQMAQRAQHDAAMAHRHPADQLRRADAGAGLVAGRHLEDPVSGVVADHKAIGAAT